MKTAVAETSLDAYHSLGVADYLQPKERQVLAAFKAGESLPRKEISERTGLPINCVTGRCNSLVAKHALEPDGTKLDVETRRYAEALKISTKQLELAC